MEDAPDWAVPRTGDKAKWDPTHPELGLFARLFGFRETHRNCGGVLEEVGTSGLLTHTIYYRCRRCGAQTSFLASADR